MNTTTIPTTAPTTTIKSKIFLLEDDAVFRRILKRKLATYGEVYECEDLESAEKLLSQENFDLAFFDLSIKGRELAGFELLSKAVLNQNLFTVVLTQLDQKEVVQKAYELGCKQFLCKDRYEEVIDTIIQNFLYKSAREQAFGHFLKRKFVTTNAKLIQELKKVSHQLLDPGPILILGETGVGKGVVASLFHHLSKRTHNSFIAVNASAIAESLIESEFFGHIKGAFTGANENKVGKFKVCDGGTLFLDEIATMSLGMQQKILKALDEKSFYPVGSNSAVTSDFHLITATCEDLYQKVREGSFRRDLFHRISSISITIPPLRERREDIPLLIDHFLNLCPRKIHLHDDAIDALCCYDWSGNVRELKMVVENLLSSGPGLVHKQDLPQHIISSNGPTAPSNLLSEHSMEFIKNHGIKRYLELIELEALHKAMLLENRVPGRAMKRLKMPHSSFYRILKREEA
ncbi:MAG: sigma-54-dependent Fis family transcriptional regulator [Oligoflexia bacterium]|nr:sigma-54-dependent Fis family transcriptional regulator [Oligoflexia bacterium]MBF0364970.1 sigma-54-dependent Fis family transcriptional regulator [Oligoflexia bacterium]